MFASALPAAGNDGACNWKVTQINTWLWAWCQRLNFGFFDHGSVGTAPGLLAIDGVHLSQRGKKRVLGQDLAGLIERALK